MPSERNPPRPATGEQYELSCPGAQAVVTELGAALRGCWIGGVPVVETYPPDRLPPLGAGCVLVPWPNRVAGGRWQLAGRPQQLALTEPARANAIHGLLRHTAYRPLQREESAVTLAADVQVQPGWPVPLHTTVRYQLTSSGLRVTHELTNLGEETVPFGVGAHPYLTVGGAPVEGCSLQLAGRTVLAVDESMRPRGDPQPVAGTELDFRRPQRLDGRTLDTAFGGCEPEADGLVQHRLWSGASGVGLWAEPAFGWVQAFTPPDFPGQWGARTAVAVEPMSAAPDALNNGRGLRWLEPGERDTLSWGIGPIGQWPPSEDGALR